MKTNILVLGGSGFVSSHMVRMAMDRGWNVWTVTRGNRPLPDGVRRLIADRNDPESMKQIIAMLPEKIDAVVDCICYTPEQARQDIALFAPITSRIMVISTDSVYHPYDKKCPQDEHGERYLTDGGYGALKREVELVFQNECPPSLHYSLFRPGHIFGPGSELGCFPEHARQKDLLAKLRAGEPMRLVGGGTYLIHPIYVGDLVRVMLDAISNEKTYDEIFCIGGPDILPNFHYFTILGELLGVPVSFETIPEEGYMDAHPGSSGNLCQRAYDLRKLAATGIKLPDTSLREGLRRQVDALIALGR